MEKHKTIRQDLKERKPQKQYLRLRKLIVFIDHHGPPALPRGYPHLCVKLSGLIAAETTGDRPALAVGG